MGGGAAHSERAARAGAAEIGRLTVMLMMMMMTMITTTTTTAVRARGPP